MAGHRLGALEGGGGSPLPMHPLGGGGSLSSCLLGGGVLTDQTNETRHGTRCRVCSLNALVRPPGDGTLAHGLNPSTPPPIPLPQEGPSHLAVARLRAAVRRAVGSAWGVSSFGAGGGVAELLLYWNSSVQVSPCGRLCLWRRRALFYRVVHRKAGDRNVRSGNGASLV